MTREEAKLLIEFWQSFNDPADFIAFYDTSFQKGEYNLHDWQKECNQEIGKNIYTSENPLELCLLAVNGSGKDRMVIGPFAPWFCLKYIESLIVITSSSGQQLSSQTEKYIRYFCECVNTKHHFQVFEILQRHIKNQLTGSEIRLFATDEAGKAEGYHPFKPGRKFAIIANEAKSIDEEIFKALTRCTGFSHRIDVSSPGLPDGHFFNLFNSSRENVKKYRITSDMCPHLGESYKLRVAEEYGIDSAYYRSLIHAEFNSSEEQVVIPIELWNEVEKFCRTSFIHIPSTSNIGGLDIALGGDETTFTFRNGNKQEKMIAFRERDSNKLIDRLDDILKSYPCSKVNADAGGLGKPILDILRKRGHKEISYVYNNGTPVNSIAYDNLGCEMWFNLKRHLENRSISLLWREDLLKKQLCNRYYKFLKDNCAQLVAKQKMRSQGQLSPDRADATTLCFKDLKVFKGPNREMGPTAVDSNSKPLLIRDIVKRNDRNKNTFNGSMFLKDKNKTRELQRELRQVNNNIKKEMGIV